jgi:hypothetical protein
MEIHTLVILAQARVHLPASDSGWALAFARATNKPEFYSTPSSLNPALTCRSLLDDVIGLPALALLPERPAVISEEDA